MGTEIGRLADRNQDCNRVAIRAQSGGNQVVIGRLSERNWAAIGRPSSSGRDGTAIGRRSGGEQVVIGRLAERNQSAIGRQSGGHLAAIRAQLGGNRAAIEQRPGEDRNRAVIGRRSGAFGPACAAVCMAVRLRSVCLYGGASECTYSI